MHGWVATSSLSPSWNAWTEARGLPKGLMPKTDDFSFLLLFGQPSTLTGIPTTNESPYFYYYPYFFLAIRHFGEHKKRKKQQQTSSS
jgi:hypothetical protein